jgi:hypothetical protein
MPASSPPTPARISTMVSFSSLGSPGMSMNLMSSSREGSLASFSEMSAWRADLASGSLSSWRSSLAASISSRAPR